MTMLNSSFILGFSYTVSRPHMSVLVHVEYQVHKAVLLLLCSVPYGSIVDMDNLLFLGVISKIFTSEDYRMSFCL